MPNDLALFDPLIVSASIPYSEQTDIAATSNANESLHPVSRRSCHTNSSASSTKSGCNDRPPRQPTYKL